MRKTIYAAALALCAFSIAAEAQELSPVLYRRTMVAPFGEETLFLEAPLGMCFLDGTKGMEGVLLNHNMKLGSNLDTQLIAYFTDCMEMAALSSGAGDRLGLTGAVAWFNPHVGEKTALRRQDYLDGAEVSFAPYLSQSLQGYAQAKGGSRTETGEDGGSAATVAPREDEIKVDALAHRTPFGVSVGYTVDMATESAGQQHITGVIATTQIRGIPLVFNIRNNGPQEEQNLSVLQALMDKFAEHQIFLNENRF
jgi:hypothetical protein